MSESNGRRGIVFVNEIKLDSMITLAVMLASVGAGFAMLRSGIDQNSRDIEKAGKVLEQKADKETVGKGEMELSRRIVEGQQNSNAALVRIDEGFREIKGMIRDLDVKLDHKADKPVR
jgi:hypothetical protein